jgi:hypothetical protein
MGEAPFGFVRHRPNLPTIMHGERMVRFWKSKATGQMVEVKRAVRDVDRNQFRVFIYDPETKMETSLPFNKREPNPFQPPGAPEVLMELPLTELYEPYGNFTSRA